MTLNFNIVGGDFINAGQASSALKGVLKQLNVPAAFIKRIVIALYEAEVNVVAHAWSGEIVAEIREDTIRIIVRDTGPGIADIGLAMQEGYTTASREVQEMGFGAGMGLPNIKRNSDYFNIESQPGVGTTLLILNSIGG
jgi:anti-sigma regulatory factor (Ser/Thr protein kinase)